MPLLNEGTECWRPVSATRIGKLVYQVSSEQIVLPEEEWAFLPGESVLCRQHTFADGTKGLVAYEIVSTQSPVERMRVFNRLAISRLRRGNVVIYLVSVGIAILVGRVVVAQSGGTFIWPIVLGGGLVTPTVGTLFLQRLLRRLKRQAIAIDDTGIRTVSDPAGKIRFSDIVEIYEQRGRAGRLKYFLVNTASRSIVIGDYT